jgi:hypothetical protein
MQTVIRRELLLEIVRRFAAGLLLLLLERIATVFLQVTRPLGQYHELAIVVALVAVLLMGRLGASDLFRDLYDICWLDVGLQVLGWVLATNE